MVVIIRGKYGTYQSRTDNVTERTRFSKSRSNDLENIDQGQRSSHGTHPLMPLIICTNYGKIPSWTVNATGRSQRLTDRQTDRQTYRQGESNPPSPPPPQLRCGGYETIFFHSSWYRRWMIHDIYQWGLYVLSDKKYLRPVQMISFHDYPCPKLLTMQYIPGVFYKSDLTISKLFLIHEANWYQLKGEYPHTRRTKKF